MAENFIKYTSFIAIKTDPRLKARNKVFTYINLQTSLVESKIRIHQKKMMSTSPLAFAPNPNLATKFKRFFTATSRGCFSACSSFAVSKVFNANWITRCLTDSFKANESELIQTSQSSKSSLKLLVHTARSD
jgi:hypothetical protein